MKYSVRNEWKQTVNKWGAFKILCRNIGTKYIRIPVWNLAFGLVYENYKTEEKDMILRISKNDVDMFNIDPIFATERGPLFQKRLMSNNVPETARKEYRPSDGGTGVVLFLKDREGHDILHFVTPKAISKMAQMTGLRDEDISSDFSPVRMMQIMASMNSTYTLVKRSETISEAGHSISKVFSVLSENYVPFPAENLADLAKEMMHLGGEFVKGEATQNYVLAEVEFPEMGKHLQEKYKLPDGIIPGITIRTSDTGFCSTEVCATYRMEGKEEYIRTHVTQLSHTKEYSLQEVMNIIQTELDEGFENFFKTLSKKREISIAKSQLEKVIKKRMEKGKLCSTLGKKRMTIVVRDMEKMLGRNEKCTDYEISTAFLSLPDMTKKETALTLGDEMYLRLQNGIGEIA